MEPGLQKEYRPRRIFSLDEANQTLPLVRRILQDIVEGHRKISELYCEVQALEEKGRGQEAEEMRGRLRDHLESVEEFVGELEKIGCEFKGAQGLVDFPARRGKELVYLCWKIGEPEILFWHDLRSGYAGRRPIASFSLEPAN